MSETRLEMAQRIKLQFQKEAEEIGKYRQRMQDNCSHKTADQWWDIGLQHNFPDMLPRGVCLRCSLVIAPRHWADAGPGKIEAVPAHYLYPVVLALEQQDHALATMRDVYLAAVDSLTWNSEARLIEHVDFIYARARAAIRKQCARDIEDTSAFTGVK
jgi:hypothetical protein